MKKILIVDDTQGLREEVRDILVMENYSVFEASNGIDGLEVINNVLPDLIISDIAMPELNGYELLAALKKNVKTENIPIIFLTAKADLDDIRTGMNMGAEDYLIKPLSQNDLLKSVNNKLELRAKYENKLNDFKSQIAQYMPHELITPLNGILGFSNYLLENSDITGDELIEIAKSIISSGERLYCLIQKYLLYSSLLAEYNLTPKKHIVRDIMSISTNNFIENYVQRVDESRKDDIFLELEANEISISKSDFERIVEELLNNSIKFSEKGSKVIISSKIKSGKYFLQFKNLGTGIEKERINDIGAFVQLNRKVLEQQGMGLGLEIVRLIVELNGGEFTIDSEFNEYFKVTIHIPISCN